MKRREKGTGTIAPTPEGRFRARFPFRTRERTEVGVFNTYDEADARLNAIVADLHARAQATGNSLSRLATKLIELREREGYRSLTSQKNIWNAYLKNWECACEPIDLISTADVRQWLASLVGDHQQALATQTKRNARNFLNAIFQYAVDEGWIETNPVASVRVKARAVTRETSTFLTAPEAISLIGASKGAPEVVIAIFTGMREGEMRSLEWSDVHDTHFVVRYGKPKKGTKSGKIRRVVSLPPVRAAIARLRAERDALRAELKPNDPRRDRAFSAFVFPTRSGHHRQPGKIVERPTWLRWLTNAKISRRVRIHDLRHTCATLLLTGAWGGDPWAYEAVKELLGHSSVKVTERYARTIGLADAAANRMHDAHNNKPGNKPGDDQRLLAETLEIIERREWDSNPRMTVLQTSTISSDRAPLPSLPDLARAYIFAVRDADPFVFRRGLELADRVLEEHRASLRDAESA